MFECGAEEADVRINDCLALRIAAGRICLFKTTEAGVR